MKADDRLTMTRLQGAITLLHMNQENSNDRTFEIEMMMRRQLRGIFANRTIRNVEFGSQTDTVVDLGTHDVAMQTDTGRACSLHPLMVRLALLSDVVIPISD